MFLESSFFPFPSEVIMIPAWYLASQWSMNIYLVFLMGLGGSLAWSWLNYVLASRFGRTFLEKLLKKEKVDKLEQFFEKHGHISTFTWRLIPWIRQYISFPAGLANMSPAKFSLYTGLGAWLWVLILTLLWYFLWENQALIQTYLREISILTFISVFLLIGVYYYFFVKKK